MIMMYLRPYAVLNPMWGEPARFASIVYDDVSCRVAARLILRLYILIVK